MDRIKFIIGIWGEVVGLGLIGLVSVWDLLRIGTRGFFEWSIGPAGIIVIWLGVVLICASKHIDRNF